MDSERIDSARDVVSRLWDDPRRDSVSVVDITAATEMGPFQAGQALRRLRMDGVLSKFSEGRRTKYLIDADPRGESQ